MNSLLDRATGSDYWPLKYLRYQEIVSCIRSQAYFVRPRASSLVASLVACAPSNSPTSSKSRWPGGVPRRLRSSTCDDGLRKLFSSTPTRRATSSPVARRVPGCLVPAQRHNSAMRSHDRESFKQRGEAAGSLGPGQSHDARPVLGAVAARRPGVQDRAVLTGVEVTPAAFGLMIVECAHGAALAARPADLLVVFEEDVDFAVGSAQLHSRGLSRDFRCPESGGIARGLASRETTTEPHSPTRNPEEPLLKKE